MSAKSSRDEPPVKLDLIEDVLVEGVGMRKTLSAGESLMLVEFSYKKGFRLPLHRHRTIESVGYVVKGKLEMLIGDTRYVLEPGSSWWHPKGVEHSTRALEDSLVVEVFGPKRIEWAS
jgi:quercetin dioxygenase-like cupin family protein